MDCNVDYMISRNVHPSNGVVERETQVAEVSSGKGIIEGVAAGRRGLQIIAKVLYERVFPDIDVSVPLKGHVEGV